MGSRPCRRAERRQHPVTTPVLPILRNAAHKARTGGSSMATSAAATAWRLFEFNWIPLGAMGAALAICLLVTDFSLEPLGAATSFGLVMLYAALAYRNPKITRRDTQVAFVLGSTAQIVLVTMLITPL